MEGGWLISYVVLWVLTLLLAAVTLAHSRLLGLLNYRVGPAAARPLADGPEIGSTLRRISGARPNGEAWTMNFPAPHDLILIFISPQCSACNETLPHVKDFSRAASPPVALMSIIDDPGMNRAYIAYQKLEKLNYVSNEKLSDELNIEAVPYALYLSEQGEILAKGVVNNYENLAGLKEVSSRRRQEARKKTTVEAARI